MYQHASPPDGDHGESVGDNQFGIDKLSYYCIMMITEDSAFSMIQISLSDSIGEADIPTPHPNQPAGIIKDDIVGSKTMRKGLSIVNELNKAQVEKKKALPGWQTKHIS